jgi:hypothetical protein
MTIEEHQLDELVDLALACRASGAPRWDGAGVKAALRRVQHFDLGEVMRVVVAAAEDHELRTPAAIGNPDAPIWRRAPEPPRAVTPQPEHVPARLRCSVCSLPETSCRQRWAGDHAYLSNEDARAHVDAQDPLVRAYRIAELKSLVAEFGRMP